MNAKIRKAGPRATRWEQRAIIKALVPLALAKQEPMLLTAARAVATLPRTDGKTLRATDIEQILGLSQGKPAVLQTAQVLQADSLVPSRL